MVSRGQQALCPQPLTGARLLGTEVSSARFPTTVTSAPRPLMVSTGLLQLRLRAAIGGVHCPVISKQRLAPSAHAHS